MRSLPFAIVVLLVVAALAGCAQNPGGAQSVTGLTLNREVTIHLDDANVKEGSSDPYKAVTASFVVRVGETPLTPATATIAYTDQKGNNVTRPLSDFTTATSLTKGAEVRVDDANLTSDASLSVAGAVVATRVRDPQAWWVANGYPIGVHMDPGATLSYAVSGSGGESFQLKDIQPTSADLPYAVDSMKAEIGFSYEALLNFSMGAALQSVQAATEQQARPLQWTVDASAKLPISVDATLRNTTSGKPIAGGFAIDPSSLASFEAAGTLWWNASDAPVKADVSGGNATSKGAVTAWLSGDDPMLQDAGDFSCLNKTRADACHPTEVPDSALEQHQPLPAGTTILDRDAWDAKPADVANLTRLLDEDLVPGDALVITFDLTDKSMPTSENGPSLHFSGSASIRAVGDEKVTVPAGSFDATKVVERVDARFEFGETKGADGSVTLKPFTIDQRFVDVNFWLAKGTFMPLRIEQTSPLDVNKVVHDVLDAIPEKTWSEAMIKPITSSNVDFTLDQTTRAELRAATGTSEFSPWVVLLGAQYSTFPIMGVASAAGAMAYVGGAASPFALASFFGDSMSPSQGDETPYPAPTPISMSISSAGPLHEASDGTTSSWSKDYTVVSVSDDVSWTRLGVALDGDRLYASDEAPGWCVVVADTCDKTAMYENSVMAGDTIRIMAASDPTGQALDVLDEYTNSVILVVTVG